jgi:hypothetical protein
VCVISAKNWRFFIAKFFKRFLSNCRNSNALHRKVDPLPPEDKSPSGDAIEAEAQIKNLFWAVIV